MIKSQDELNTCNDGKRKSAVLIATIEKLEETEEKLKAAENFILFLRDISRKVLIKELTEKYPIRVLSLVKEV